MSVLARDGASAEFAKARMNAELYVPTADDPQNTSGCQATMTVAVFTPAGPVALSVAVHDALFVVFVTEPDLVSLVNGEDMEIQLPLVVSVTFAALGGPD
jgi:hypothetical protein